MIIKNDLNFKSDTPCVLALGCFDGVHLGHREVLGTAKKIAESVSRPLCVLTFEQPPRNFFSPSPVPLITSTEEKLGIFERLGVDIAVCLPLSRDILTVEAQDFVREILIKKLCAAHVVCGYDYGFGRGAKGNSALLTELCGEFGVGVTTVGEYKLDGTSVSSSLVRRTVADGDMELSAKYLGRPYSLTSIVVDGQHLARRFGFPTVNIIPEENRLLPKRGVYVTKILFDNEIWYGITNVGVRPTVNTKITCAETHIFDYHGDLYGKSITVEFLHFLREETKFPSVEAMAEQIGIDIAVAKKYVRHF